MLNKKTTKLVQQGQEKAHPQQEEKKDYLSPLIVLFTSYIVYLLTVFPTIGTEDSGELATSAINLDIAHPPGYPLHTLLGKLFTWLIPFGNMGWRVNLQSVFFSAATVAVIYLILKRLTKHSIIATSGALFFAFSDIFWSQAIRTEVYALNNFLFVAVILFLQIWNDSQKDRHLILAVLFFVLGISNHWMYILLGLPAFVLFVLIRNWKVILKPELILCCFAVTIIGLLPYLYLPIRTSITNPNYNNPAFIQHNPLNDWSSFWGFVNRKIYGGTTNMIVGDIKAPTNTIIPTWLSDIGIFIYNSVNKVITANFTTTSIPVYLNVVISQLFFLPVLFLFPGLYKTLKTHKRAVALYLGLLFCYLCLHILFFQPMTEFNSFTGHSNRPFYTLTITIFSIITFTGVGYLFENIEKKNNRLIATIIILLLPLLPLASNFEKENESHNYLAYDFNKNTLESLPQNAFLLSIGRDNSTFPLYYLQKVENVRPDVTVEIYYGSTSPTKSTLESKLTQHNKKSVFIDLLPDNYGDILPKKEGEIGLTPYNFVYQYGNDETIAPSNFNYELRGIRKEMDYPNNRIKGLYYVKKGIYKGYEGDMETAKKYFNKVISEIPENIQLRNVIKSYLMAEYKSGMF